MDANNRGDEGSSSDDEGGDIFVTKRGRVTKKREFLLTEKKLEGGVFEAIIDEKRGLDQPGSLMYTDAELHQKELREKGKTIYYEMMNPKSWWSYTVSLNGPEFYVAGVPKREQVEGKTLFRSYAAIALAFEQDKVSFERTLKSCQELWQKKKDERERSAKLKKAKEAQASEIQRTLNTNKKSRLIDLTENGEEEDRKMPPVSVKLENSSLAASSGAGTGCFESPSNTPSVARQPNNNCSVSAVYPTEDARKRPVACISPVDNRKRPPMRPRVAPSETSTGPSTPEAIRTPRFSPVETHQVQDVPSANLADRNAAPDLGPSSNADKMLSNNSATKSLRERIKDIQMCCFGEERNAGPFWRPKVLLGALDQFFGMDTSEKCLDRRVSTLESYIQLLKKLEIDCYGTAGDGTFSGRIETLEAQLCDGEIRDASMFSRLEILEKILE